MRDWEISVVPGSRGGAEEVEEEIEKQGPQGSEVN